MAQRMDLNVLYHRYDFEDFLKRVSSISERDKHHSLCWRIRLKESANVAVSRGIKNFTTTLLSSPHQDIVEISSIGEEIAGKNFLNFLIRDFGKGFADSHKVSKEWQLYHQNYCGCLYSEKESIEYRERRKKSKS